MVKPLSMIDNAVIKVVVAVWQMIFVLTSCLLDLWFWWWWWWLTRVSYKIKIK